MTIAMVDDIVAVAYKISCLVIAFGFGYLGYRLFGRGIFGDAGDLEATFKDNKILLKRAAPGTFFAVLGAAIAISTVWSHLSIQSGSPDTPVASIEKPNLP